MILGGLIEESAKLIVPLALLMLLRRPDPQAGIIIGIASGMGFATLETMGYGFTALLSQRNGTGRARPSPENRCANGDGESAAITKRSSCGCTGS